MASCLRKSKRFLVLIFRQQVGNQGVGSWADVKVCSTCFIRYAVSLCDVVSFTLVEHLRSGFWTKEILKKESCKSRKI